MKRKILFILPDLPYPLTAGGFQALYNGITSLKDDAECHIIYIDSFRQTKNKRKIILDKKFEGKVALVPFIYNPFKSFYDICRFFRNFFASFFNVKSKSTSYSFNLMTEMYNPVSQEHIDFVNNYIKEKKIEIVQFEFLHRLSHSLTLPSNVKKIFVHHELGFVVNEQRLQSVGHTEYRDAMTEMSNMLEIGLLNKCDAIITLSEIDKSKLVDAGVKIPIFTSFAVVNTSTKITNPNELSNILSFVGPSFHAPNYLGVKWFLDNCWETLLSQDSSYRLKIIGNWSEDKRDEILKKYKNIEFAGFVENLADALNNTIMIVPITVGSGIRMKILEAASLGIPFVSTSVGADGLPFENGKNCFLSNTPETFVESILKLKDKSLRMEFATKANELVKEKYSMEALRRNRLEIYEKVMNDK